MHTAGTVTVHPPHLHFVWLGPTFPYHARLAIESAVVAMPSSPIDVHLLGTWPRGEDFERVAALPSVTVRPVSLRSTFATSPGGPDAYRELFNRLRRSSPAACSNLIRLGVLHQHGGIYLDTDTIVLKPLHEPQSCGAFVGAEHVWALNRRRIEHQLGFRDRTRAVAWAVGWCEGRLDSRLTGGRLGLNERSERRGNWRLQVNNAVIGAPPGADFVERCLVRARQIDPSLRFALGPSLLDDVTNAHPASVHVLPPSRFYAVPPGQSYRLFEDRFLQLPSDAHVIHYVASNHRRLLASLTEDDRRFDSEAGVFWSHARRVRSAIGVS